jgi:hypothetical protein
MAGDCPFEGQSYICMGIVGRKMTFIIQFQGLPLDILEQMFYIVFI